MFACSNNAHPIDQVNNNIKRIGTHSATKLLIFNVHGTLLDCSLLAEPNTFIRMVRQSLTRRIVFRPWLTNVIDKCFGVLNYIFLGYQE